MYIWREREREKECTHRYVYVNVDLKWRVAENFVDNTHMCKLRKVRIKSIKKINSKLRVRIK